MKQLMLIITLVFAFSLLATAQKKYKPWHEWNEKEALKMLNDPSVQLTLAGRCDEAMLQYIQTTAGAIIKNIHFAGIIQPEELPAFAARFDVGMAIELTTPENRNICLTNKIFTYLIAGNAIIISETDMQVTFNKQYQIGEIFKLNDMDDLMAKIKYYKNREQLDAQKRYNYALAEKQMNWGKESEILLTLFK